MGYECLGQEIKSFRKDTLTASYMSGTEFDSGEVWLLYDNSKENRRREGKMEFLDFIYFEWELYNAFDFHEN